MRAVLRPVPVEDPRPNITDPRVAERIAGMHAASLTKLLVEDGNPTAVVGDVSASFIQAVGAAGDNTFLVASHMASSFSIGNEALALLIIMIKQLPYAKRLETSDWSLRRSLGQLGAQGESSKPLADVGDQLEWLEPGETEHAGLVIAVNRAQRTLTVTPHGGVNPFDDTAAQAKIIAEETVYANVTKGLYAFATIDGQMVTLPSPELIPVRPVPDPLIEPDKIAAYDGPEGPEAA